MSIPSHPIPGLLQIATRPSGHLPWTEDQLLRCPAAQGPGDARLESPKRGTWRSYKRGTNPIVVSWIMSNHVKSLCLLVTSLSLFVKYIYLNHVKSLLGGSSHLLGYIPGSFYGISKVSPLKKLGWTFTTYDPWNEPPWGMFAISGWKPWRKPWGKRWVQ
jgi:hypothetical protein